MIENIKSIGKFIIKGEKEDIVFNRVTNAFLNAIANALDGVPTDLEIKYLAIGTSNSALNDDDTTLGNEIFRLPPTTSVVSGTGQHTAVFPIGELEAVGSWREIGIFCGSTASLTPDTGTMISRVLYTKEKTNLEAFEIHRIDTIVRG